MREVHIAPKEQGKGRTFFSTCLASVEADALWDGGHGSTDIRPVWAMFAGGEQEMRPFVANLTLGRKIQVEKGGYHRKSGDRIEFLKSVGYQVTWQREEEGSIVTVFLPDLFRMDPGMVDPNGIRFVILPPTAWVDSEQARMKVRPVVEHAIAMFPALEDKRELVERNVPLAYLFSAFMDRRTRCPLVADGRFYMQLMLACLDQGLASWSSSDGYRRGFGEKSYFHFVETSTSDVGLDPGIAVLAGHEVFEKLLAEQVEIFFEATKKRKGGKRG